MNTNITKILNIYEDVNAGDINFNALILSVQKIWKDNGNDGDDDDNDDDDDDGDNGDLK